MKKHIFDVKDEELVDLDAFSKLISENKDIGYREMQEEDYCFHDNLNPFHYMNDFDLDYRSSIHCVK